MIGCQSYKTKVKLNCYISTFARFSWRCHPSRNIFTQTGLRLEIRTCGHAQAQSLSLRTISDLGLREASHTILLVLLFTALGIRIRF